MKITRAIMLLTIVLQGVVGLNLNNFVSEEGDDDQEKGWLESYRVQADTFCVDQV
jgi:hypothetical protein